VSILLSYEQSESTGEKRKLTGSPGRILKKTREAQGKSLKQVADSTKILERYLEGLEEEKYEHLPSEVYIKGYLQSYARYLKIDPEQILQHLSKEPLLREPNLSQPAMEKKQSLPIRKRKRAGRNFARAIAIGMVVIALGITLTFFIRNHRESARLAALVAKIEAPFIQAKPGDSLKKATPSPIKMKLEEPPKAPEANVTPQLDTAHTGEMPASSGIGKDKTSTPEAIFMATTGDEPPRHVSTKSQALGSPGSDKPPILPDSTADSIIMAVSDFPGKQGVIIDRYSLCSDVENRIPLDERSVFSLSNGRVYTWMHVKNAAPPLIIRHIYYFQGQKKEEIALEINHPNMRTWSYKNINHPQSVGMWRVDIAMEDGEVLKSINFHVIP
jgi:cytoskeletal protein RodZ